MTADNYLSNAFTGIAVNKKSLQSEGWEKQRGKNIWVKKYYPTNEKEYSEFTLLYAILNIDIDYKISSVSINIISILGDGRSFYSCEKLHDDDREKAKLLIIKLTNNAMNIAK